MPKIYRVMKKDGERPMIGSSATTLGVRVPADIRPDASGDVHPGTGGMSVSPSLRSLRSLPARLIPTRLRQIIPGAAGSNSLFVWSMGERPFASGAVTDQLDLRPDPNNSNHGFVEPGSVMELEVYEKALAATQGTWRIDEG